MNILFTARHYLPLKGGLQESTHQLIAELHREDHRCSVLTALQNPRGVKTLSRRVLRKVIGRPLFITDMDLGYPKHQCADAAEGVASALAYSRPDFMVMSAGGAHTLDFTNKSFAARDGIPAAIYIRDIASVELLNSGLAPNVIITNAEKLSEMICDTGRSATTIPSVIHLDTYMVATSRKAVLYINPVESRGLNIALETARLLPDIPFIFQQAWQMSGPQRRDILEHIKDLPNVQFKAQVDTPQELYGEAKILFCPYQVQNRPRVIHEAAASSIPTVATAGGGLAEATGSGGILVPLNAAPDQWARAICQLWDDTDNYQQVCKEARKHAERREMQPGYLAEQFLNTIRAAIR